MNKLKGFRKKNPTFFDKSLTITVGSNGHMGEGNRLHTVPGFDQECCDTFLGGNSQPLLVGNLGVSSSKTSVRSGIGHMMCDVFFCGHA